MKVIEAINKIVATKWGYWSKACAEIKIHKRVHQISFILKCSLLINKTAETIIHGYQKIIETIWLECAWSRPIPENKHAVNKNNAELL